MSSIRTEAIVEYTSDIVRIESDIASMSSMTKQLEDVDKEVQAIMDDAGISNLDKADQVYKYSGLKKQMHKAI